MTMKYASKTKCLNFIMKVQAKAEKSVENKYKKALIEKKLDILKENGILDNIIKMQEMVKEIIDLHDVIKYQECKDLEEYDKYNYGSSLSYRTDFITQYLVHEYSSLCLKEGEEYTEFLLNYIATLTTKRSICNKEYLELENSYKTELREVKDNYLKVYRSAKDLKTGKQVVKFLENLGFDISSLIIKEENVDIDTEKLFVCGQNK